MQASRPELNGVMLEMMLKVVKGIILMIIMTVVKATTLDKLRTATMIFCPLLTAVNGFCLQIARQIRVNTMEKLERMNAISATETPCLS